ncbi:MAG: alpha amylase C-terminal domain-containing protein, partial [Bacteroidetes bacterium]|nr:alpha amylase C-terminal domain-containing protein [Bacteroidota bacterium]
DMVSRCRAAGVDIYVDAVLNHMTGVYAGVGTAGSTFAEYEYPGLYSRDDFHHCGMTRGDDIEDWDDPLQVRDCELVNLADLKTEESTVRARLAEYASDMLSLGVAGFRLDAARHMPAEDIGVILDLVGGEPYIYQEVLDMVPEPTWALEYVENGSVTEFRYGVSVGLIFRRGSLASLHGEGSMWERVRFLASETAVVFLDNHDTQRHSDENGVLTYKDGALYDLGLVYMLAYPYGRPRVMSSFEFATRRQGPPALEDESIKRVHGADGLNCARGEWVCEHRRGLVTAMVRFRKVTASEFRVTHWWTDGRDRIAFGRGGLGFVAINRSGDTMTEHLQTGLPKGSYCNVLSGDPRHGPCSGLPVEVDAKGLAELSIPAMTAVALHVDAG